MKKLFVLSMSMCMLLLASCGGSDDAANKETTNKETTNKETVKGQDVNLTPSKLEIEGPLKAYFTVVDKKYIAKNEADTWTPTNMIAIELERTATPFEFDYKNYEPVGTWGQGVLGNYGIGIKVYDATNNIIVTKNANDSWSCYSSDDLSALKDLGEGESAVVRWKVYDDFAKLDDPNCTFVITSSLEENDPADYSDDEEDDDYYSDDEEEDEDEYYASSSSSDWDDVLDEYEDYVDDYIAVLKKANNGDMTAFSEMGDLLEDAQELADELKDAKGDLTSAQLSRYTKILNKMTNAMY